MTQTGVVVAHGADRWWAWAASRVTPSGAHPDGAHLDGTDEAPPQPSGWAATHNQQSGTAQNVVQAGHVYGGVHIYKDQEPAPAPDDSAWLRSCWEAMAATGATMEMRYLTRPGEPALDGFLIVRTEGLDREEAERRVVSLRAQLGLMPGHVTAIPVTEQAETHRILEPFQPSGILEVRKRLTVQRASRDDAHHPWLTAVTPLTYQRQSWEPLWSKMAGLPFHAMVSVGLVPYPVGPGLRSHLAARAADLSRLARQGPPPIALWSVPRPPDEFAVAAFALISDAVRRYTDRAFLTRMSIAAERPIPGVLAELAADTFSARTANHGFEGAGPKVVRPEPADAPTAWSNITTLNFSPLSAYNQGNPAEAIGDLEQVLSAIVDLDEAAAAFRLPYQSPGNASLFAG